jgi:hypothetical protein
VAEVIGKTRSGSPETAGTVIRRDAVFDPMTSDCQRGGPAAKLAIAISGDDVVYGLELG